MSKFLLGLVLGIIITWIGPQKFVTQTIGMYKSVYQVVQQEIEDDRGEDSESI